jgi:alkanesulfonate monooxygenase SsuD/methylene tetrahydromethanopterin reductase-like flavin-dependent oxidoreductase (luciferase family)
MTDHLQWSDLFAYEAWTVMSFLAAKWTRFDIGSMVFCQNYRNPALLAKMGATLQVFSQGRLIMGVGAGWKQDEYESYGYTLPPVAVRMEQLQDTLEILKRMWTEPGKVTYHGKHYRVVDAYCEPKPDPVPVLVVGGGGKKTMRLAAKHANWWNVSDVPLETYKGQLTILDQHCADLGRDPRSIRRTWFGRVVVGKNQAAIDTLIASRDTPWTSERAFVGTPSQIVEQMRAYVDAGCDYFMIDVLGLPNPDIEAMVLEEILPQVKR